MIRNQPFFCKGRGVVTGLHDINGFKTNEVTFMKISTVHQIKMFSLESLTILASLLPMNDILASVWIFGCPGHADLILNI
jgi:hypothetical protein